MIRFRDAIVNPPWGDPALRVWGGDSGVYLGREVVVVRLGKLVVDEASGGDAGQSAGKRGEGLWCCCGGGSEEEKVRKRF